MCRIYVEKLDVSNGPKGAYFLRKSKNGFVISDRRFLQCQKNPKSEKGLFAMTTQTNKPRVAGLFWRNFSMKMPPEKKTFIALDKKKNDEKTCVLRSIMEGFFAV